MTNIKQIQLYNIENDNIYTYLVEFNAKLVKEFKSNEVTKFNEYSLVTNSHTTSNLLCKSGKICILDVDYDQKEKIVDGIWRERKISTLFKEDTIDYKLLAGYVNDEFIYQPLVDVVKRPNEMAGFLDNIVSNTTESFLVTNSKENTIYKSELYYRSGIIKLTPDARSLHLLENGDIRRLELQDLSFAKDFVNLKLDKTGSFKISELQRQKDKNIISTKCYQATMGRIERANKVYLKLQNKVHFK